MAFFPVAKIQIGDYEVDAHCQKAAKFGFPVIRCLVYLASEEYRWKMMLLRCKSYSSDQRPKSIDLQLALPKNIPANKLKGGDIEEIVLTRT